jgi:hypothetical protein
MSVAYLFNARGDARPDVGTVVAAAAGPIFGLVAFGFLGMGPMTIAVGSYRPVTDNAQSVYEPSLIEHKPDVEQRRHCMFLNFERGNIFLRRMTGQQYLQGYHKRFLSGRQWSAPQPCFLNYHVVD